MRTNHSRFQVQVIKQIQQLFPQARCNPSSSREAVITLLDQSNTLLIFQINPSTYQVELKRAGNLSGVEQVQTPAEAISFAKNLLESGGTVINSRCQPLVGLIDW